jgi:hypothetical protein
MVTLPFEACQGIMMNRPTISGPPAASRAGTGFISNARLALAMMLTLATLAVSACAPPEDPARVELRDRLRQEARLSETEITRLTDEVAKSIDKKTVRITVHDGTLTPQGDRRAEVFSVLHDRTGVYDEGLKREGGTTYRILNGPGDSDNAEIEATQRLWVDIETLLPRRYEFTYAFQGYGDYAFDLAVEP